METKSIELYCEDYAKYLKMFTSIGLTAKKAKEAASNLLLKDHGVTIAEVYDAVGITISLEGKEASAQRRNEALPNRILNLLSHNVNGIAVGVITNRCRPAQKNDVLTSLETLIDNGSIERKNIVASNNKITEKYFLA